MTEQERAMEIIKRLMKTYPDATTSLNFKTPWQLLVATILAAQSTDKKVNEITPIFFKAYPTIEDSSNAEISEVEKIIYSCGFYHQKAKFIKSSAIIIMKNYKGLVPKSMSELLKLPGVSRKTANVVLSAAFKINEGIAMDTHTIRLSTRLELSHNIDPKKIEVDLMKLFPKELWGKIHWCFVEHGRNICTSQKPKHSKCVLFDLCPSRYI
jgi:endonuclease-3